VLLECLGPGGSGLAVPLVSALGELCEGLFEAGEEDEGGAGEGVAGGATTAAEATLGTAVR
jgi:hypothetical protein